jgi:hypothetical protein
MNENHNYSKVFFDLENMMEVIANQMFFD